MKLARLVPVAIAVALVGLSACGGDSQSLLGPPPPPGNPATLLGAWQSTQPGGYQLRYVFRRDGTYSHFSGNNQKRKRGTYRFAIRARGTVAVRGRTLVLRPRNATIERHDPDDPSGDFDRSLPRRVQRYEWLVRGTGEAAKLTMRLGGRFAVTYSRR